MYNNKIWIVLLFFIPIKSQLWSQDKGDELWQSFVSAENDSSAFEAFEKLYMYNIGRDLDRSKELLNVMDSLCQSINFEDCRPLESLFNGYYFRMTGSYDTSLFYLEQTHDQYQELGNEGKMAVALFNQGVVTSYKGDYEGAVQKYILARDLYEKVGNVNGSINVSNGLGIIYKNIKEYEKSKDSYSYAEKKALESDNQPMLAMIYNNISNLYHTQASQPDSVLHYAEKALDLEMQLERNTGIASAYNLISAVYMDIENYDQALTNAIKALEYSKKSKNNRFIAIHEMGLADIYAKLKNFNRAERHYLSALSIADSISLLKSQKDGREKYSELLASMNKFESAYEQRLIFEEHLDAIKLDESRTEIADLEAKYESALKDKAMQSQELEIAKKTYQRNIFIGGMGLSILAGGFLVWGFNSRLRRNKTISHQQQELKDQKINTLEKEKKLLSMASLLEGQESERIRIAKDLHDGLGGLLTTVKAHISTIKSEIDQVKNLSLYNSASKMIDKAYDEVRRISHNLMPSDLRAGGLPFSVRQLVHELKEIHHLETDFELIGFTEERLDEKIELSSYRIIQELVNNILKYANAEKVFIQLSKFKDEIQIIVEDNGIGFDFDRALESEGLGLKSITSRIDQLGGELDVDSKTNKGTSYTINIPVT